MSNHDPGPLEERFFLFEQQDVTIHDFESLGYVLDIGGGGEGIKGEERNYLVPVVVTVKDRVVDTGYGQPWPEEEHDLAFFVDLAEKSGFQVMEQREDGQTFFLQLQKP